jgi:hypothetical protein
MDGWVHLSGKVGEIPGAGCQQPGTAIATYVTDGISEGGAGLVWWPPGRAWY